MCPYGCLKCLDDLFDNIWADGWNGDFMKIKYLSYIYSTSVKCTDCRDGFYFNSTQMNCLKISSDNNLVSTSILNFEYELDC